MYLDLASRTQFRGPQLLLAMAFKTLSSRARGMCAFSSSQVLSPEPPAPNKLDLMLVYHHQNVMSSVSSEWSLRFSGNLASPRSVLGYFGCLQSHGVLGHWKVDDIRIFSVAVATFHPCLGSQIFHVGFRFGRDRTVLLFLCHLGGRGLLQAHFTSL